MAKAPVADEVRSWVEGALAEDLYWFPVRHHSPVVARHLQDAILERKPEIVFIEGPADASEQIPHLVDRRTKPPVAIYSSYRDDDNVLGLAGIRSPSQDVPARFAMWYPLLQYSPELVAMKAAHKAGADVVFMDLPHHGLILPATAAADEDVPDPLEVSEEGLLTGSSFYRALAEEAGFRNWDQAWDSLFEFGAYADDRETFRRELMTFCAATRYTTERGQMAFDGTLARERFMWRTIRETLAARKTAEASALVVCGGFHVFLDRDDPEPPPELPPGTVYTSVVPYSFFRISKLSGYGAGNRAPKFYQSVWELSGKDDLDGLVARHVVATLKRARREGEAVSSADAISVTQHARLLAAVRGRPRPILDDIHDAVITCCCKGDPQEEGRYLQKAMDVVDIGAKIGSVTPDAGRLPLVNDFYGQLDALELQDVLGEESRLTVKLDKREELDRERSLFLRRVRYLDVPFGRLVEEKVLGSLFKEVWQLRYTPDVESKLVEQSLYGDTFESACLAVLKERLAAHAFDAGQLCRDLRAAVDIHLPMMLQHIQAACRTAIATDTRFVSLADALHQLRLVERQAQFQDMQRDNALTSLVDETFERACFTLPDAANVPDSEQEPVVEGLRLVAEALLADDGERLERDLFVQHVESAASASDVPFLRGAFLGMLTELRVLPAEEASALLAAFAREPAERMVTAGDFLGGMLAVSRTSLLLGADHLVAAIDELLDAAAWEPFLIMLPRLRAAFDRLHERQRDTLALRVARRYGLRDEESLAELDTSVQAAALFATIDREVARILDAWEL